MSCPHVVDYEPETGALRKYDWNNGSDDTTNSTWSRGQSWGLYGYTMMYRETGNLRYLQHAEKIADFLLSHPNMPADMIPLLGLFCPSSLKDARHLSSRHHGIGTNGTEHLFSSRKGVL